MPSKGETRRQHNATARSRLVSKGVSPKTGEGSRRKWTIQEDALIMDEFFDIFDLSKKLDRTVDAIYLRRSRILRGLV